MKGVLSVDRLRPHYKALLLTGRIASSTRPPLFFSVPTGYLVFAGSVRLWR